MKLLVLVLAVVGLMMARDTWAQGPRVLFLSKSSGFEHSCIKEADGQMGHVQQILAQLAEKTRWSLRLTKNASEINSDNLKNYDVVIFYTTGNLTEMGQADKGEVMPPNGVEALLDWIKAGGGFIGYHSATDTFHTPEGATEPTPFIQMIGAEFRTHGPQFEGIVRIIDPGHPTMDKIPRDWKILDEWYLFRNFNTANMRVLAVLDPGPFRAEDERYNIPNYPIIWCSALGKGRVYQNAMGHREDVWSNPMFLLTVVDAVSWAAGEGDTMAEPNFSQAVTDVKAIDGSNVPAAK